jgi:hypothetical protein
MKATAADAKSNVVSVQELHRRIAAQNWDEYRVILLYT